MQKVHFKSFQEVKHFSLNKQLLILMLTITKVERDKELL